MPAAYFHNIDIVGVIGSSPTNPTKKRQVLHGPVFSWSDSQHAIRSPAIVGTISSIGGYFVSSFLKL